MLSLVPGAIAEPGLRIRFMSPLPLTDLLSINGAMTASSLLKALQVSRSTLSRMVAAEKTVIRLGRTRATRYALPRRIAGLPVRIPVYRISGTGGVVQAASLVPIAGRGTWVEPASGVGHLHEGLPPVVFDMAPAGYLGRRFADRNAVLDLPPRLEDWSDDHRLIALARRGEDAPGDLVIGEESLDRFLKQVPAGSKPADYPRLARESAEGGAGSSAAGEQPKFTAFRDGRHFLVKFTIGDGAPSDLRWRDLYVCESLALETLAEAGVSASRSRILDVGDHRFLEVERFDRVGVRGRRGVLTLGPLDDDLFGHRDNWSDAATRLHEAKLLSPEDARRVRLLEAVAMGIANGDRHFGNLAFFADGLRYQPPLGLAPAYDMLPMSAAPRAGVIPEMPEPESFERARLLDVIADARKIVDAFWDKVGNHPLVSRAFRKVVIRRKSARG